jgi:hypothetical protein
VLTARPLPASAARNAATVSGEAGNAVWPWAAHHHPVKRATAAR